MSTDLGAPAHPTAARVSNRMQEVGRVAWLGAVGGGLAGLLAGGVGGRLAMLVLRLTSPEAVRGRISDDGFRIGQVSRDTFGLLAITTLLGVVLGLLYVLGGRSVPVRWRVVLWTLALGTMGATAILHGDGIDFNVLEPLWLAVVMFTVIPLAGAWLCATFVERWEPWWPSSSWRGWWRTGVVLAVMLTLGWGVLFVIAVLAGIVAVVGLVSCVPWLLRLWRLSTPWAVTALLILVSGLSLWALRNDVREIL